MSGPTERVVILLRVDSLGDPWDPEGESTRKDRCAGDCGQLVFVPTADGLPGLIDDSPDVYPMCKPCADERGAVPADNYLWQLTVWPCVSKRHKWGERAWHLRPDRFRRGMWETGCLRIPACGTKKLDVVEERPHGFLIVSTHYAADPEVPPRRWMSTGRA